MKQSDPPTHYSISAVARITGHSRTTIQRHIKKGKLSVTTDADNKPRVEAAEMVRVYGNDLDLGAAAETTKREEGATGAVQHQIASLQQQVDSLAEERRREREQLQAQIEHLQQSLKLAQEGHNKAMLLLEDRSGGGEWRREIEAVRRELTASEARSRKEGRDEAIRDMKDQPWWRLLWA